MRFRDRDEIRAEQDEYLREMRRQLVDEAYDQGARDSQIAGDFADWFLATYTLSFSVPEIPKHLLTGAAWTDFLNRRSRALYGAGEQVTLTEAISDQAVPTKQRPGDQPLPTVNGAPCVQDQVIADIEERKKVGIQRYGTVLQPFNDRNPMQDLYEELLDGAMYAKQNMIERETIAEFTRSVYEASGDPQRVREIVDGLRRQFGLTDITY